VVPKERFITAGIAKRKMYENFIGKFAFLFYQNIIRCFVLGELLDKKPMI
jgi:hypothetical protein